MNLTFDEIHNINFIALVVHTYATNLVSMMEKVDKSSSNGIHISSWRSNAKPKHAEKNVKNGEKVVVGACILLI